MDSNAKGNADSKAEFRKPSNDAANRKYRRRSPMAGSPSSSDGSPPRDRSSSPVPLRKDITKVADDEQKRDDGRNRTSSRSHHRHDDHIRRDKRVDDYDRGYSKQSYRSSRDSRDNSNSNYSRSDREHPSRHYVKDVDTYSRAKSDGLGHRSRDKDSYDRGDRYGRTDYRKSSLDHKGDDYYSRRDSSGYRLKESSSRDYTEIDPNDEKKRVDMGSHKVQINRDTKENSGSMSDKGEEAVAKKPKTLSPDGNAAGLDGPPEKSYVTDSDIDAAKVAAMKAAELVNKNLIGTGCMTADQKKKLLWGNKKNTSTEEPAHRWDTTMFGDRERQEKFNKLMSLRLDWCLWPIVGREGGGVQGGDQAGQSRCREAAGAASDGVGETVHGRFAPERWPDCRARPIRYFVLLSFRACYSTVIVLWRIVCCAEELSCYMSTWCLIVTCNVVWMFDVIRMKLVNILFWINNPCLVLN